MVVASAKNEADDADIFQLVTRKMILPVM